MSIRMTEDEIAMLQTVIRTSSNCRKASVIQYRPSKYDPSVVRANIPVLHSNGDYISLEFDTWIPDVEAGADAAAKMLMFMGLEKYPLRVATFDDYVSMAYEFGKQNRWD